MSTLPRTVLPYPVLTQKELGDLHTHQEKCRSTVDVLFDAYRSVTGLDLIGWSMVGHYPVVTMVGSEGGPVNVVVVPEDNIKTRFVLGDKSNATWRYYPINGPALDGSDGISPLIHAVVVAYGWSQEPGGYEEQSTGNKYKPDYRRMAYVKDLTKCDRVRRGPDAVLYNEIQGTVLTQENIRRLLSGEPLESFVPEGKAAALVGIGSGPK